MPQKTLPTPPLERFIDLSGLSHADRAIDLVARGEELIRLALWADVVAVHAFGAHVALQKVSQTRFSFAAELSADIEQKCVVTLEPVFAHIALAIQRELQYSSHPAQNEGELTLAAGDDEAPDAIDSLHYDLAAPLLEEFSLSVDPYPRKEDARFSAPVDVVESPRNPFAALGSLKKTMKS